MDTSDGRPSLKVHFKLSAGLHPPPFLIYPPGGECFWAGGVQLAVRSKRVASRSSVYFVLKAQKLQNHVFCNFLKLKH